MTVSWTEQAARARRDAKYNREFADRFPFRIHNRKEALFAARRAERDAERFDQRAKEAAISPPPSTKGVLSRSGYSDECDGWSLIRWRGAVASSLRGNKGQAFLREALEALDALPAPELIPNSLAADGAYCMLGAVGRARGADLASVDPDDHYGVAAAFRVPHALACEIMFENDEGSYGETPRARWERMRSWIVSNIKDDQPAITAATQPAPLEGE